MQQWRHGKVCLSTSTEDDGQALTEINVHARLFGTLEYPPLLANRSLEEKAEGLWFLVRYIYICLFFFQGVQCKDCKYNAHKKCSEKVPRDCTGEIALVSNFDAIHIVSF